MGPFLKGGGGNIQLRYPYPQMGKTPGFFPSKDMQTSPLRSGIIYMEDTHSVESNEKSIFPFLFYELCLIVFKMYGDTPGFSSESPIKKIVHKWPKLQERCAMS